MSAPGKARAKLASRSRSFLFSAVQLSIKGDVRIFLGIASPFLLFSAVLDRFAVIEISMDGLNQSGHLARVTHHPYR
jgi:hypothetical protein